MILSVAVLTGFQYEIRNKIAGFSGHVLIDNFDANDSFESAPVRIDQPFYPSLEGEEGIRHIQPFCVKAGIIKTGEQMQGVLVKGIDAKFDWGYLESCLVEGSVFVTGDTIVSDQVLISSYLRDKLALRTGGEARVYFISPDQSQPRARKFIVAGIYETGLEEIDKNYLIVDMRHIQRLNGWDPGEVTGFEVFIDDFGRIKEMGELVYSKTGYFLFSETIVQMYPQIFDWLRLMDMNVVIIMALMVAVAAITMVSALLILILERTESIGLLKALGMKNKAVREIFLFNGAYILSRGLLWGNIAGIGVCLLQDRLKILPLDSSSYYMDFVPARLDLVHLAAINAGTFLLCFAALIIPSFVISRITPVKAMKFQ
jgi:lipoprotein-releasing system permease protein